MHVHNIHRSNSLTRQLLEVFDSLRNGTLDGMNSIVKSAVNLCTALYIGVGFFGYVAYYKQPFSGERINNFHVGYEWVSMNS